MLKDYQQGDLVWIPPREDMPGCCGIVTEVRETSLVVMFPDLNSELELARGWFATIPVSGSLVPGWPEFGGSDLKDSGVTDDG